MGETNNQDASTTGATRLLDPTAVPHLDDLLGGGLPRGALSLIMGPPGSGKTTLAAQIAITAARAGRKALILTAFSEPVLKLISHLQTLSFFDDQLLNGDLQILSLTQFLANGLESTADDIRTMVRRGRYSIVVLDGFRGVRTSGNGEQSARRFLYEIGSSLQLLNATTIITSEAEPADAALYPETTTADVLLALHYGHVGLRERRHLEVVKMRGLAKLPGLHTVVLTANGMAVYPRLETRISKMQEEQRDDTEDGETGVSAVAPEGFVQRASFGLPELDALLGGGITRETSTLLLGSPGAGKTLLALHWLSAGIENGEPAVYLGFRENRRQLLYSANTFGLGPTFRQAMAPGGLLTFVRLAPVELDPDVLADALLSALDRTGARRLVIDSVGELERAVTEGGGPSRVHGYVAGLIEALRARSITTLALRESAHLVTPGLMVETDTLAVLAENVLLLQHVTSRGRLHRVLSAPKMRFSVHDLQLREFMIALPEGIRVLAPIESEAGVLADIATQQGMPHQEVGRDFPQKG